MATDLSSPEAVLNHYVDCCRRGDAEGLKPLFHPQASMYGYLKGQLVIGAPDLFFDTVASAPCPDDSGEPYRAEINYSHHEDDSASLLLKEENYLGMDFVNSFQLLRIENRWLIVSKLFRSTG